MASEEFAGRSETAELRGARRALGREAEPLARHASCLPQGEGEYGRRVVPIQPKHATESVRSSRSSPVNALDSAGWNELAGVIERMGRDPAHRCLLIRGEGRGFCAGVDIKEMQKHPGRIVELNRGNYLSFRAVRAAEVPVITAVHGFVIGGGIGLSGASDVIIAADDAYFSLPEIDRGAMGGAAHMMRMLPLHKVRALFFTGGSLPAAEAHRLGAVEKVVPRERLLEEARAFATVIAGKSRTALVLASRR